MPYRRYSVLAAGTCAAFVTLPALAHHPMGGLTPQTFAEGLLSGLAHPLIGPDHLLFLITAGLLAGAMAMPRGLLATAVFIGATVMGTVLHLMALTVPLAESLIALTLVCGGGLLLTRRRLDLGVLGLFFAAAGLLHGYAYGEAIVGAEISPLGAYLLGFALIQGVAISAIAFVFRRLRTPSVTIAPTLERITGAAILLGGLFFLATSFAYT